MIKFTWLGTATIKFDIEGEKLLFDPFFRMNDKLEKPELKETKNSSIIVHKSKHIKFDFIQMTKSLLSS